jgi:hypothetical protein
LRWDDFTARTEILRLEQTLPRRPVKLELVMAQDGQVTLRLDDEEFALGQTSGPLHAHPIGYLHVGFIMENSRLSERAPMLSGETGLRKHPFPGSIEDFSIRFGEPAA